MTQNIGIMALIQVSRFVVRKRGSGGIMAAF